MKNFLKAAFAAGIFTIFCGATPVTSLTEGYFTFSNFTCTNIYNAATDCAGYTLYGVGGGFENGVAQGVLIVFDRVAGGNAANPDLFSLSYEVTYTGPYDASDLPLHFSEEYDTAPPNTFTVDGTSFSGNVYCSFYQPDNGEYEAENYNVEEPMSLLTPEPSTLSSTLFGLGLLLVTIQQVRRSSRFKRVHS